MTSGSRSKAVGGAITVTIKVASAGEGPVFVFFYFFFIETTSHIKTTCSSSCRYVIK